MSASNYNWVCFDCRFVTRQAKVARRVPKCAECGSDCYCLGYKVEIPKATDTRAWRALRTESRKRHLQALDTEAVTRVREAHEAQRQIAHLRSLGSNKDREKMIKRLKEKFDV